MKRLFGAIDKHAEMYQVGIMYAMQTIGAQHPELLQGHEALFERLGKEPTLKTYCDQCLDIIAGRRYIVCDMSKSCAAGVGPLYNI